jgi:hypothetical protein
LGFLLSAGYFKAAKSFFPPSAFHRRDLEYVARQLELEDPWFDFSDYNPRTRQLHEITIRTFYGFRVFDPVARRLLLKEIAGMVRSQLKPKLMLWLCVDALVREKIEVPSYSQLTNSSSARSIGGSRSLPRSSSTPSIRMPEGFWMVC